MLRTPGLVLCATLSTLLAPWVEARGQSDGAAVAIRQGEGGPRLVSQPRADYKARRQAVMKRIREIEQWDLVEPEQAKSRARSERRAAPVVVLIGQDESAYSPIGEGRYRQKNDFVYLTGVEAPSAGLILLPGEDRETLYLPPSRGRSLEEAPEVAPGARAAEKLGFERVASTAEFLAELFSAIADPRVQRYGRSAIVYVNKPGSGSDSPFVRFLREGAPNAEVKDLSPILGELRKAKTETEIALLRKAIAITGAAQREVAAMIRPGLFEYELEGKIIGTFTAQGAERAGFSSIVGSGPNSTIPHYFANRRKLEAGDLVVVDIGAEFQYYTADITRTYPASGTFSSRQREIYQLVLDVQSRCAQRVKPGVTTLREMTSWAREAFRESPLTAKDREGREQSIDHFFIHGLGHYLGMDVHDVGDTGKALQPGEVFTIEPGLYIPSENLGVRIEDDYLVTDLGLEKLSEAIPSDPDSIERQIAAARAGARAAAGADGESRP
ncbi:MAG TPA: aminopeptidase P N-terminal domain-containing protein [Isosphaeraceae bacterium]|nr:aminopeptidase P N-terminal domain-containing protein [Isosphaeraceae bacterium]